PRRRTNAEIIHQQRNYTGLRIQHCFGKKLGARAECPMTEDNACKTPAFGRHDEVCSNASALRTGVRDVVYVDAVAIYNADFSDIKRRLLVVIEHLPQFIDGL